MRIRGFLFAVTIVLMPLCGCRLLRFEDLRHVSRREQRAELLESIAENFRVCRSIAEVKQKLKRLDDAADAQLRAECLLAGWGRHGDWYDVAVVEFLLSYWPSAYGKDSSGRPDWERYEARRLFDVTQEAVRSNPELVYQVFWYRQWESGPCDFSLLMRHLDKTSQPDVHLEGEMYPIILLAAGIASGLPAEGVNGTLMGNVSFETLSTDRLLINGFITSQRPFLRYDRGLGRYIVDREAKEQNRYLSQEEQVALPRPTSLPGWRFGPVPPYKTKGHADFD